MLIINCIKVNIKCMLISDGVNYIPSVNNKLKQLICVIRLFAVKATKHLNKIYNIHIFIIIFTFLCILTTLL